LRFAVHGPGSPVASPRSHGVPRRDVPGRVHVSVAGVSAGGALEDGLALARVPVHLPARRAPLARERGVDLLHPARRLLFQAADQQAPPGPQYAPVQPGLLANIPALILRCSFGGSGHVLDLEVFDPDHVEPLCDISGSLFGPVSASVGLAGPQPGDGELHSCAAVGSAPRSGQFSLQPPHTHALRPGQAGRVKQFTRGQGRGHRHSPVDTYDLAGARPLDRRGDRGERDMPASRAIHRHPVRLHARGHGTGPAETHPSGLWHPHLADVAGDAAHVPMPPATPHDAEPLVSPGLPPGWLASWVHRVQEAGHGPEEVPKRLLLHCLGACVQPRVPSAGLGELPTLFQVAGSSLSARVPVRVLLDGQVPHIAGVHAVISQHPFLGGRGEQTVPGHANSLATATVISGEVKRRLLTSLKSGVSTPRS
jgi:hypothetical protein